MLNGISSTVELRRRRRVGAPEGSERSPAAHRRQRPHARADDVHPPRIRAGRRRTAADHVPGARAGRALGGRAGRQPRGARRDPRRDAREPALRARRPGVIDRARRALRRHGVGREPAPAGAARRRPARLDALRAQRALPAQRARQCAARGAPTGGRERRDSRTPSGRRRSVSRPGATRRAGAPTRPRGSAPTRPPAGSGATRSTTLPRTWPASSRRCASAPCSSGSSRSTCTRTRTVVDEPGDHRERARVGRRPSTRWHGCPVPRPRRPWSAMTRSAR